MVQILHNLSQRQVMNYQVDLYEVNHDLADLWNSATNNKSPLLVDRFPFFPYDVLLYVIIIVEKLKFNDRRLMITARLPRYSHTHEDDVSWMSYKYHTICNECIMWPSTKHQQQAAKYAVWRAVVVCVSGWFLLKPKTVIRRRRDDDNDDDVRIRVLDASSFYTILQRGLRRGGLTPACGFAHARIGEERYDSIVGKAEAAQKKRLFCQGVYFFN